MAGKVSLLNVLGFSFNPRSRGEIEPYDFCSGGEPRYEMRQHCAMMPSKEATTGGASWP